MMKTRWIALVLPVLLLLAACSSPAATPPEAQQGSVSGIVIDATMNGLTIEAEDGNSYRFATEGVEVTGADSIALQDEVTISYNGELTAGNDNKATATRITVTASAQPGSSVPQQGSVSGLVIDATMNGLTIEAEDGNSYHFATEGVEVTGADSIALQDEVTISYNGELTAGNDNKATATRITITASAQPGSSVPQQASSTGQQESSSVESPAPGLSEAEDDSVYTLDGTVENATEETLSVSDATGVIYLFSIVGAEVTPGTGALVPGAEVTIYYKGELYSKPEVQDVTVSRVVVG